MRPEKPKISRPDYYQGILQLRNVNDDLISFVLKEVEKRNDVAITKVVKQSGGQDLYITSKQFLLSLGKKLKEKFSGVLTTSASLHTKNRQGHDLYRVNVFFKLLNYKIGDIVNIRGDDVKLLAVGAKIFAKDVKTGKKLKIRPEDLP